MEILIQNQSYTIQIERKRIKNLILKVEPDYFIKVSAPINVSDKTIIQFIYSKESWIIQASRKQNQRSINRTYHTPMNGIVMYFGKKIKLSIEQASYNELKVYEDFALLKTKETDTDKIKTVYEREMKKILASKIEYKKRRYDLMMDDYRLPHPDISIKKMTSKWGSCIPAKAKISINLNLVYLPEECLDYVLLHEYVHMIVPNHSKRFYQIVESRMPDYKRIQKIMKEN